MEQVNKVVAQNTQMLKSLSYDEWQLQRRETNLDILASKLTKLGLKVNSDQLKMNTWLQMAAIDYIESVEMCQNCTNPSTCPQRSKGMKLRIDFERADLTVTACEKYRKYKMTCKLKSTLETAKIGDVFRTVTLDSLDDRRRAKAKQIVEDGTWAFIYGDSGVGKTHLAVAILQETIKQNKSGLFCVVPTLMNELRRLMLKDHDAFYDMLNKVMSCDVLLLDDLGAEKATGKTAEWLYLIINDRYINSRQTLITSNLDLNNIVNQLGIQGSRITSRIMGKSELVKLGGKDRRMIKEGAE